MFLIKEMATVTCSLGKLFGFVIYSTICLCQFGTTITAKIYEKNILEIIGFKAPI